MDTLLKYDNNKKTGRIRNRIASRAQKFRIITNRLTEQLITAKAFAIILKRKLMFGAYLVNNT